MKDKLPKQEEIEATIKVLETKYNKSRSTVEKTVLTDNIKKLNQELRDIKNQKEVTDVFQKDVPVRVDHKDSENKRVAFEFQDDKKTFITTL
jgi:hypothetical protein